MVDAAVGAHEFQQVDECGPAAPVHPQVFLSPGWSGVLAKEVGGELEPEAPSVGAKGIEEGEEVLGAEDSVSQGKRQRGWDDTPAVLHHPCVWSPLHSRCLSRAVHNCLSWGTDRKYPREEPSPALSTAYALSM